MEVKELLALDLEVSGRTSSSAQFARRISSSGLICSRLVGLIALTGAGLPNAQGERPASSGSRSSLLLAGGHHLA